MSQLVVFVQGIVLYLLVYSASITWRRRSTRRIVAGLRPRHAGIALASLIGTVVILLALESLGGPLKVGWWSLMGGKGSALSGGASASVRHPLAAPLMAVIPFALLANIPAFALREEIWFRRGSERRSVMANAQVAMVFGLAHMVAGVPLSAALAIAAFGGLLSWRYVQMARGSGPLSALHETARIHTIYNTTIVFLLGAAILLRLVAR